MEFYKALDDVMQEMNLSIPEVARKSNLSDSTVRSIINRKSKRVALEVAVKISNGLGVPLDRLNDTSLGRGDFAIVVPEKDTSMPILIKKSEKESIINEIISLSDTELNEVKTILNYLKHKREDIE